ncbi:hypothetical protein VTK73DRAFT_2098 [Phialemonium thermophilum]|uniref:Uncharacterized protein n=1 Tax=Phialemonium thermophilum TaxID=223376 RepID=A0ABR3VSL7_9PEZI
MPSQVVLSVAASRRFWTSMKWWASTLMSGSSGLALRSSGATKDADTPASRYAVCSLARRGDGDDDDDTFFASGSSSSTTTPTRVAPADEGGGHGEGEVVVPRGRIGLGDGQAQGLAADGAVGARGQVDGGPGAEGGAGEVGDGGAVEVRIEDGLDAEARVADLVGQPQLVAAQELGVLVAGAGRQDGPVDDARRGVSIGGRPRGCLGRGGGGGGRRKAEGGCVAEAAGGEEEGEQHDRQQQGEQPGETVGR